MLRIDPGAADGIRVEVSLRKSRRAGRDKRGGSPRPRAIFQEERAAVARLARCYGKPYAKAIEATGKTQQKRLNAKAIADAIPLSQRRK